MGKGDLLTNRAPSPDQLAADIRENRFAIYDDVLSLDTVAELRTFWLDYFRRARPSYHVRPGGFRLGEPNFLGFSRDHTYYAYRDFDFLWNEPTHALTRQVNVALHQLRNEAQGYAASYGLEFSPNGYAMYGATSLYPAGGGFMRKHADAHYHEQPILQFMLSMTHREVDFEDGGLYLVLEDGTRIDVEGRLRPGSVAFFDALIPHGVAPIVSRSGVGRIGTFAIPTFFLVRETLPKMILAVEEAYHRGVSAYRAVKRRIAAHVR